MNRIIITILASLMAIEALYVTPGVWGAYGECSKSCGGGKMEKLKMCGTYICGILESSCNSFACEDPLLTADWTPCDNACKGNCDAKDASGNVLATIVCNGQCGLSLPTCNKKVVFVVDRTGSVEYLNFVREKQFIKDLVSTFQTSVDVGLVAFSSNAITYQNFASGNSVQQTNDQVDAMAYDGAATQTVSGLEAALDVVKDETNAVVVVLAHTGTTSKNGFDEGVVAVSELISQHASIIAIQMSTIANQELAAIAPNNIVQVDSPSGLSDAIADVASRICA